MVGAQLRQVDEVPREVADFGLCRLLEVPTSLFFPGRGEDSGPAKAICKECDVREACLEYALNHKDGNFGVWGGTSDQERRRIRRRRKLQMRGE